MTGGQRRRGGRAAPRDVLHCDGVLDGQSIALALDARLVNQDAGVGAQSGERKADVVIQLADLPDGARVLQLGLRDTRNSGSSGHSGLGSGWLPALVSKAPARLDEEDALPANPVAIPWRAHGTHSFQSFQNHSHREPTRACPGTVFGNGHKWSVQIKGQLKEVTRRQPTGPRRHAPSTSAPPPSRSPHCHARQSAAQVRENGRRTPPRGRSALRPQGAFKR